MTLFGLVNLAASRDYVSDKMSINACASNEVPRSPVDANFKAVGASRMRKQQEQEQELGRGRSRRRGGNFMADTNQLCVASTDV
ncbi:hypothetical protein ACLKA6_016378 [Drosophila palustris]